MELIAQTAIDWMRKHALCGRVTAGELLQACLEEGWGVTFNVYHRRPAYCMRDGPACLIVLGRSWTARQLAHEIFHALMGETETVQTFSGDPHQFRESAANEFARLVCGD